MSPESEHRLVPARALSHPLWWGALALLLLNDHVLKSAGVLPSALTGKLSDVAGLIVAPVLLAALLQVRARRGMWIAIAAVGAWFALVNTWPAATRGWEQLTAFAGLPWKMWCDPSDLLTLPALGVSAWLMLRTAGVDSRRHVAVERLLAMAGAVSCMATSVAPPSTPATTPGKILSQGAGKGPVFVIESSTGRRLAAPELNRTGAKAIEVNGVVYGVSGSTVVGVSLQTEEEVMRFEYEDGSFRSLALTDGSRIFLLAKAGARPNERLVAVDLKTGKLAWQQAVPGSERGRGSSKQPIYAGGLIVVPVESRLAAFDPGTGRRQWVHQAKSSLHWPTVEGRAAFAVDEEGTIVAIELEHGNPLWHHPVGDFEGFEADYFDGPRMGAGSGVLVYLRGNKITAIESDTRARKWQGPEVEDLVVGKEIAVARMDIEDDAHLVAFRMSDGKKLWKLNADDWLRADPTLDEHNGLVLIRPFAGELRAYTMKNAQLQWRFLLNEGKRADTLY